MNDPIIAADGRSPVIAAYGRSPFTFARKGALVKLRPDDLAAQVVRGVVERAGLDPDDVEDLVVGCAFPEGEQGFNVARIIGLLSGSLPIPVSKAARMLPKAAPRRRGSTRLITSET